MILLLLTTLVVGIVLLEWGVTIAVLGTYALWTWIRWCYSQGVKWRARRPR